MSCLVLDNDAARVFIKVSRIAISTGICLISVSPCMEYRAMGDMNQ